MFSYSQLLDVARCRPINLFLAETMELVSLVEDEYSPRIYRNRALAELVVRWCFSGDQQIDGLLAEIWKEEWESDFKPWYSSDLLWSQDRRLPDAQWKDPDGFCGFVSCLRTRLLDLFRIDGFIPVYDQDVVRFIPFRLDETLRSGDIVYDDGEPVVEWQSECKDSIGKYAVGGCRLQMCHEEGVSLCGASLMLPLRMAYWRKEDAFPKYDVLRVVATGAFDDQNRLMEVGITQKLIGLKAQFRDAILLGPDGQGDIPENERRFRRLDCGITEGDLRQAVIAELERTDCVSMSYRYALRRLPDMHAEVDRENYARWCNIADRLYRMRDGVPRDRDGEHYLQYMIMLVTALCHAGRTDDARKEIDCAYRFAEETGKMPFALRLQINAMVVAQDDGDVVAFHDLSSGISERLSQFNGDERDDLLMRFHGTSMQAHAWGDVFGIEGFSREESLRHSNEALKYAYAIANSCSGSDEAESNVAQDRNYHHLWYALFSPGTCEENEAYDAAFRHHNDNLSARARTTNLYHLKRQKSLALFNHWRTSGIVAGKDVRMRFLLPKTDAEGWMVCANRRHLGALAAADGCNEEAIRYFEEGDTALPLDKCFSPVLASIRFSLLVQAASSLKGNPTTDASAYFQKADEVKAKFGKSKLFGVMGVACWMSAPRSESDSMSLSQFYY